MRFTLASSLLLVTIGTTAITAITDAFQFVPLSSRHNIGTTITKKPSFYASVIKPTRRTFLAAVDNNEEEDDEEKQVVENPYADPNYPDVSSVHKHRYFGIIISLNECVFYILKKLCA